MFFFMILWMSARASLPLTLTSQPPMQYNVIQKIWKGVQGARKQPEQVGLLPIGDVLMEGKRQVHDNGRTH